jgi:hypothetical protein
MGTMHGPTFILLAGVFLAVLVMAGARKVFKRRPVVGSVKYVRRSLMTAREFEFFGALRDTLPDAVIHSQVAMAALVDVRGGSRSLRNTFDRKIFDFVVCRADGHVLYVVELDDHRGEAARRRDSTKDEIALAAGLRIVRYQSVRTDAQNLRRDYDAMCILAVPLANA